MVTAERFAQGMTFADYVAYVGTPENLAREAGWWLGPERRDFSGLLRAWHARVQLTVAQMDAIRWLATQPGGPAKVLVISEEWSSDCRRDVPMLARLAEAGGLERLVIAMQAARPGETTAQAWERFMCDWVALQQSPFFLLWASAGVDEILSALHERLVVGAAAEVGRRPA